MKVFFDPGKKRRKWLATIGLVVLAILALLNYILFVSLAVKPDLPELALKDKKLTSKPREHTLDEKTQHAIKKLKEEIEKERILKFNSVQSKPAGTAQVEAYMVGWDENSTASLYNNLNKIDVLLPVWLGIKKDDQSLNILDQEHITSTLQDVLQKKPSLKIIAVINNYDSDEGVWDSNGISIILNNRIKADALIQQIYDFALKNQLSGISVDFETMKKEDQPKYVQFLTALKEKLSQSNLTLSASLPLSDDNYDYTALGKVLDEVVLMAYDEHWTSGPAGPIASQEWFQNELSATSAKIPASKLVVAMGSYAYDWTDGEKMANTLSYAEAIQVARESEGEISMDDSSINENFEYFDENNKHHQVYLLDGVSAYNEKLFADTLHPKAYAVWRLGSEDGTLWSIFSQNKTDEILADLSKIPGLSTIDYEGEGDILKIKESPTPGQRKLTFDNDANLITDVNYAQLPSGYVIGRNGKTIQNAVALSFDDGPDAYYTPKILDILKKYNVKATFFVIGMNAEKNIDLIKRIVDEGHLLGNHTFTHPNITLVSDNQLNLELNATQLILESVAGIKTVLFRPPYAEDIEPETLSQADPLKKVSDLGYYTIGISIDPYDWAQPGIQSIVDKTVEQAEEHHGGVVLLHDSGGNRDQTVSALPLLIEGLQAKGFKIVPLNEMLGLPKTEVNPPAPQADMMKIEINEIYLEIINFVLKILSFLFFFSFIFGIFRFGMIIILAVAQKLRHRKKQFKASDLPKVSVIIAAYNEETVIKGTVLNILESDYPREKLEIVVVDDGSKDQTWQVLQENFLGNPNVQIYTKENGGKSAAINYGLEKASGEIMVSLDADTWVDKGTVKALIRHFADERIGAVAGNAKVGNRVNLLTKFQALEYVTNQNLDKRAFDLINSITVVPGAIGAWRIDLIRELGGFNDHTLAEDSDLTMQIIKKGYRVHYEELGLAYTEAPMSVLALYKQRYRWVFGTLQVFWKNRKMLFNPKNKGLGLVGMPSTLFFQIISPLVLPIADLSTFFAICLTIFKIYQHGDFSYLDQTQNILFFFALFTILDYLSCVVAFMLEEKEDWRLLLWLFPQRLFYRFFMNWICLKSLFSALSGTSVHWNKLERKGNLQKPA